jgi:hypothetical protein
MRKELECVAGVGRRSRSAKKENGYGVKTTAARRSLNQKLVVNYCSEDDLGYVDICKVILVVFSCHQCPMLMLLALCSCNMYMSSCAASSGVVQASILRGCYALLSANHVLL